MAYQALKRRSVTWKGELLHKNIRSCECQPKKTTSIKAHEKRTGVKNGRMVDVMQLTDQGWYTLVPVLCFIEQ